MSLTWRSILRAREVIEKGAIKTIGEGSSVYIWEDPWVPNLPKFRLLSQKKDGSDVPMHVKDLCENQSWNWTTLSELFSQREIDGICSIPVPLFDEEDVWSWHHSKDERYSVKSAYNLLVEEEVKDKATSSNGHVVFNWKSIWHARIPP